MEDGVVSADLLEESSSEDAAGEDDGIDYARIYTFTHANGEVATGTILDIRAECIGIGSLPMKAAVRIADMYDRGVSLDLKKEEPEPEEDDEEQSEVEVEHEQKIQKTEKKANGPEHEETVVSEKDSREIEQPAGPATPRQEIVTPTILAARAEATDSHSGKQDLAMTVETAPKPEAGGEGTPAPLPKPGIAAGRASETYRAESRATAASAATKPRDIHITEPKNPIARAARQEAAGQKTVIEEPAEQLSSDSEVLVEKNLVDSIHRIGRAFENQEVQTSDEKVNLVLPPEEGPIEDVENIFNGTEPDEASAEDNIIAESTDIYEFQQLDDEQFMEAFDEGEETGEEFALPIPEALNFELPEYIARDSVITYELPIPVEEVEHVADELAERIADIGAEESELVHQVLDEIVLKVEGVHSVVGSDAGDQEDNTEKIEETQEELEELFVQLFEMVGIEYTEEIIDSFVKLTLKQGLPELILKTEEDATNAVHDSGTHEILKQISAAITSTKKAVLQAYRIGQSALHLYSLQFAFA